MKRTRPGALILAGAIGLVVAFLLQVSLTKNGSAMLVLPFPLPITLAASGVIVLLLAVPVARSVRGKRQPVNPFYAVRVAVLAKACSVAGGLFLGGCLGMLLFVFSRTVLPGGSTVAVTGWTTLAAAILLACGLIAEHLCTLPPEEHDEDELGSDVPPEVEHA